MKYSAGLGPTHGTHQTLMNLIEDGSTVLDVGCAQGYLDRVLTEEKKCKVYGLELEEEAAKIARAFCEEVIVGNIEEITLGNEGRLFPKVTFDYILLADIVEHTRIPEEIITYLVKTYLKPGGYVILSLPNIAHFSIRLGLLFGSFTYKNTGIMDNTHLKFFTRRTVRQMLHNSGLEIREFRPVGDLNYLLGKVRLGALGALITKLLPNILSIQFVFKSQKPIK